MRRVAALAGVCAAAAAGAYALLLAFLYGAVSFQRPDPDPALDGDPCCGHPDTWGQVVLGSVATVVMTLIALGLLALAAALAFVTVHGRLPGVVARRRRAALRATLALAGLIVLVVGWWVVEAHLG